MKRNNGIIVMLAVAVFIITGCYRDTTREIPMFDGSVVVEPYKVRDQPGMEFGFYIFKFLVNGTYTIIIEVDGETEYKRVYMVTDEPKTRLKSYGNSRLSFIVATIKVTDPHGETDRIRYNMAERVFDRDCFNHWWWYLSNF